MHISLLVAVLICALAVGSRAAAPVPGSGAPVAGEILDRHAKGIAAALPADWQVRVEGDSVWIEYQQAVEVVSMTVNAAPGPMPKVVRRPALLLVAVPAVTQAEVDALNKKNADRGMALQMLAAEMKDLVNNGMPMGDQGGYRAANPDQQARLDAYVAVVRALPYVEPPAFFARGAAFRWGGATLPVDPALRAQMEQLKAKVEALFAAQPVQ